jgi:hypothetical protein
MQLMVNLVKSCRQKLAQKCDAHSKIVTATEHFQVWKELRRFTIHSQGEHGQLNEMDFTFHNNKVTLSVRLCAFKSKVNL